MKDDMRLLLALSLVALTHAQQNCNGLGKKKCLEKKPNCKWMQQSKECVAETDSGNSGGDCPDGIWETCGALEKMKACKQNDSCTWPFNGPNKKTCVPKPPCDVMSDSVEDGPGGMMDMDKIRMMIEEVLDGMLEQKIPMRMIASPGSRGASAEMNGHLLTATRTRRA